eukprot:TRINITY_DN356_c0_g1_i4.p1 TRINITY_DN356_c0_g1~~TRINITY_DN356_c0_g1_i4.p1  ORF type:complete len:558 (+),score=103.52 TRINITY_DN356_c0_g1_i4:522-2195(+)
MCLILFGFILPVPSIGGPKQGFVANVWNGNFLDNNTAFPINPSSSWSLTTSSSPFSEFELALGDLALPWSGFSVEDTTFVALLVDHGNRVVEHREFQGEEYVAKTFRLATQQTHAEFMRECGILVQLQHPRVAEVRGVMLSNSQATILFPRYSGDLGQWLSGAKHTVAEKLQVLSNIIDGVAWIHSKGVIHRDIKPANIFIDGAGRAVLGDFGISKSQDASTTITQTVGIAGTAEFLAPELQPPLSEPHSQRSDIYALGLVIKRALFSEPSELPETKQQQLLSLLALLLHEIPAERPTAEQTKSHPFLQQGVPPANHELLALPPHWISEDGSEGQLPTWSTQKFAESEAVCRALEDAMRTSGLASATVTRVWRLENVAKFRLYASSRMGVLSANGGGCSVQVAVATQALGEFWKTQGLCAQANEVMLWHGTSVDALDAIMAQMLDHRFAIANGALFGEGLYFAESAVKSNFYAKANSSGCRVMLLCRVVLGAPYFATAHMPAGTRRAPVNAATGLPHDCVIAAAGVSATTGSHGAHREFVVFDHHQSYPQYVIEYTA